MSELTRDEFNGLGARVNKNQNDIAINTTKIETVKEDTYHNRDNIGKLFDGQQEIKIELKGVSTKITIYVGAISALAIFVSKVFF